MDPETDQFSFATVDKGFHHLQAFDYSGDISQIEEIVGLSWCRSQVLLSKLEHIYGCINNLLQCFGSVSTHYPLSANVQVHNPAEDS